jgi:O-antigen/teichoic acid export membrane protein
LSPFKRFLSNIFWTLFGKIGVQFILFAISILLTRYLGKERLGIYATLLVIPAFVRLLNCFGLETIINKCLPEINVRDATGRQGRYLVRRILLTRLLSTGGFCGLLYMGLPVYLGWIQQPELLSYRPVLILYFSAITIDSLMSTLFMTWLRYKTIAMTETACSILNLILLAVFIVLDFGITGVLYAYLLSLTVNILIYIALSLSDLRGESTPIPWDDMPQLAWVSYGIGLLSFGLMTQSDVVMMNYFQVSSGDVGFYHLATGLSAMLAFAAAGVGPLALSLFSETYARESAPGLSKLWIQIVGFSAFLTAPIYLFALLHAKIILQFVYGVEFAGAALVFSLYTVFATAQTLLGHNFNFSTLYVLKRQKSAMRFTVEGSLLNIGLNLILIPKFGVLGAVGGTGGSMVYMAIRQLVFIDRELQIRPVFPLIARSLLYSAIAGVPTLLIAHFLFQQVIAILLCYLALLYLTLLALKPFTREHQNLVQEIQPGLEGWIKPFVRQDRDKTE